MLKDRFDRRITYLRLSVTDRCNLRCVYCLPEHYGAFADAGALLTDDEMLSLCSTFTAMGLKQIRITGGEPLLRVGLAGIIRRIADLPGVDDVSLSTNGVLLAEQAEALAGAGLDRVNISLDSLREDRFHAITRFGKLASVHRGIEAALKKLAPVKINVVVSKGVNDDEIADFVALTQDQPIHVRFIELMPMGATGYFSKDKWLPLSEMMRRAGELEPLPLDACPVGRGPARYYKRPGAVGTVGFISAMSCGFCDSCNRVRLSSNGVLHPCLDSPIGVDLKAPLRAGAGKEEIRALILKAIDEKPEGHKMVERGTGEGSARFMCSVGG